MCKIEQGCRRLHLQGTKIKPTSLVENFVGFCERCEGELLSYAYYRSKGDWLVAARCERCGHMLLIKYDRSWEWQSDSAAEVIEPRPTSLSSLSREQLDAVFSPAELKAMEACERGETYVRQNLSRARAKYDKFERLFGQKMEI